MTLSDLFGDEFIVVSVLIILFALALLAGIFFGLRAWWSQCPHTWEVFSSKGPHISWRCTRCPSRITMHKDWRPEAS